MDGGRVQGSRRRHRRALAHTRALERLRSLQVDDRVAAGQQGLLTGVLSAATPLEMIQWYNVRDDDAMTCCPPAVAAPNYFGLVQRNLTPKDGFTTLKNLIASGGLGAVTP